MRWPRPVCAFQPASAAGGGLQIGAGELRRGKHRKRILHEMRARRADAVAHGLAKDARRHLGTVRLERGACDPRLRPGSVAKTDDLELPLQGMTPEPLEMRVVAIENGRAARQDPLQNFGLGVGDRLDRAKEAEMHRRHRRDDGDVRLDQLRERHELAGMIHAGFEHAEVGGHAHIGERQRHAPVIVVGLRGRMHVAGRL